MTPWAAVEDAVVTWVKMSGFPVILAEQGGPRPEETYISVAFDGPFPLGQDERTHTFDVGQPAGQEILHTVTGMRRLIVKLQCFYGDAHGEASARAILSDLQTRLGLPTARNAFDLVGIGVTRRGQVRNIPAIRPPLFEGRATLEVELSCSDTVTERGGYIDTVRFEGFSGPFDVES